MNPTKTLFGQAIAESVSLESKGDKEKEYVFFGKLKDANELSKALRYEDQEQWEVRTPYQGKDRYFGTIRIRKTTKAKSVTYVLCMKTSKGDGFNKDETEYTLPSEAGEKYFKEIQKLATSGMRKRRYFYPVEGHSEKTWEVDVFYPDGLSKDPAPWCKIDLEVARRFTSADGKSFPLPFPVTLENVIYAQPGERTDKEQRLLDKLMATVFVLKSPHQGKKEAS